MPLYVYKCASCGKVKELQQPYDIEERVEPVCHECREEMVRVWLPTHFHFKGGGFYATDKNKAAG